MITLKRNLMVLLLAVLPFLAGCGEAAKTDQLETQQAAAGEETSTQKTAHTQTILFFGNSLTAGYGLEPDQAFPALIQERIDSLGLPYKVINAGVSGETTAGGKSRIDWLLKQPIDIFVLELGANDGLRGINLTETYQNLLSIIGKVRAKYPDVKIVLAGMQIPPNMGKTYAQEFRSIYTRLEKEENIVLIPFLLENVAGIPELNQADGVHPTVEGQKIVAENVWEVLEPLVTSKDEA
ncbi:arylesterase [Pontibacter sp. 172403-2]|uniref:arylesterase n=1 Tax=Pontibacter rufus TaxID=2791028 RepID=UPI0018AF8715|nr:arylesterase [Pontibacter sp. 172403-2]MBF9253552.1 arylesterase [Pontibacter sp. 172403-2]